MTRILLALLLALAPAAASAQSYNQAQTPDPGQRIPVFLQACLDAQGRAIPPGPACAASTGQTVSGTVTSNQGTPNAGGSQSWYVQWANQSVAVSNFPAVQPVSGTVTTTQGTNPWVVAWSGQSVAVSALPSLPAGTNTIGAVTANQGAAGATPWPVTQSSQPLPTGASTAAAQTAVQSAPGTSASTAQAVQGVTGGVPQNVAASSLPLPANAAQETGGNLATLVARTPALVNGASPVTDPNNAAYSAASATYATGATVTAGRAVYLNCSAAGSVTLTLSGGGSVAYPVAAGANVLAFAVTAVSADTASCTHQNVN